MADDKPIATEEVAQEPSFEKLSEISDESNVAFHPVLYNFRTPPTRHSNSKKHALQLPFAVLFDNLITVLWAVYGKNPRVMCGINQIQWALEFLKTMKEDYTYPESVRKIVKDFEKTLIDLYAKVGDIMQKKKIEQELEEERELESSLKEIKDNLPAVSCVSYNEQEIVDKLNEINVPTDSVTGEVKSLKELNSLGRRKAKAPDTCKVDKNTSKTYMIGALQKLLNIPPHETKSKVEELIKGLKVQNADA